MFCLLACRWSNKDVLLDTTPNGSQVPEKQQEINDFAQSHLLRTLANSTFISLQETYNSCFMQYAQKCMEKRDQNHKKYKREIAKLKADHQVEIRRLKSEHKDSLARQQAKMFTELKENYLTAATTVKEMYARAIAQLEESNQHF